MLSACLALAWRGPKSQIQLFLKRKTRNLPGREGEEGRKLDVALGGETVDRAWECCREALRRVEGCRQE